MDSRNANNQQDTGRCHLMFSAVSGFLVSDLLAFLGSEADTAQSPITAFRASTVSPRHAFRAFQFMALAPLVGRRRLACDHEADLGTFCFFSRKAARRSGCSQKLGCWT